MKTGADGMRTYPDGSPFTILWEYSTPVRHAEFVKLMTDYLKAVGLNVNAKELTSEATRENAKAETLRHQHGMGRALRADAGRRHQPLHRPIIRTSARCSASSGSSGTISNGASGEEPPAWAKRMFEIAKEWKTVVPGSDRYMELGKELVKLNLENMTIIGTDRRAAEAGHRLQPPAQREDGHGDGALQLRLQLPLPCRPVVHRGVA